MWGICEKTLDFLTQKAGRSECGRWGGREQGMWKPGTAHPSLYCHVHADYLTGPWRSYTFSRLISEEASKSPLAKTAAPGYPMVSSSSNYWHFQYNVLDLGVLKRKKKRKKFNSQIVLTGSSRPYNLPAGHGPLARIPPGFVRMRSMLCVSSKFLIQP